MTGQLTEQSLVPVELTFAQWQAVINVLADGSHRVVAPLITQIGQQVQQFTASYNQSHVQRPLNQQMTNGELNS